MRFGLRAHDLGRHSPVKLAARIREEGLTCAQLALFKAIEGIDDPKNVPAATLSRVGNAFRDAGVELSVLGCYIEPSLADDDARRAQVDTFLKNLEYAAAVGAKLVGTETTRYDGDEAGRETQYARLLDSVLRMAEKAEKTGVPVGIEPVAVHTLNTPELAARLMRDVNSPFLRIIFDPVNLVTVRNRDSLPELWARCFAAFGDKIAAVHLKDVGLRDGAVFEAALLDGFLDFAPLVAWLVSTNPDLPLLREGYDPVTGRAELLRWRTAVGL